MRATVRLGDDRSVRAARDLDDFRASAVGAFLVGKDFVYAVPDAGLSAMILRGRPDEASFRALVAALWLDGAVHVSMFDASAVTGVDPAGFAFVTGFVHAHRAAFARSIARQALVIAEGLPGAALAGFSALFEFPYPVERFTRRDAALAWLGRPDAAAALAAADAGLASAAAPIVTQLRTQLAASWQLSLAEAARQLGVSERSLQRHLHEAGSSFQLEVAEARVAVARRLLADTDAKVTAIALEVGCATSQSFSAMFRRHTGETPSAYRARLRR